jgi:proteasome lid subunit RPN8/RPN11
MLVVSEGVMERLNNHAIREAPREACGVLGGRDGVVTEVWECRNASKTPEACYEIAPEDLLRAVDAIESKGLEVIGFYHSHPMGLSKPSVIDEKRAAWPDYSYVIISLSETPGITSWRWMEKESRFVEESLRLTS